MKITLLSMASAVMGKPFWKYDQPERFVQWGEEAVGQLIEEGYRRVAYFSKKIIFWKKNFGISKFLKNFEKREKWKRKSRKSLHSTNSVKLHNIGPFFRFNDFWHFLNFCNETEPKVMSIWRSWWDRAGFWSVDYGQFRPFISTQIQR